MAKTMRNIVITCILLIVLAVCASAIVMSGGCSTTGDNPLARILAGENPFQSARTDAINTLIDVSGVKDRIESELQARAEELSEETGLPLPILEYGIETLAIQDWEATEKPTEDQASETGTYSVVADGTPLDITAYDDPSYITVTVYGQEITLAVPESAQPYVYLLPLLEFVE